jgi:N-acetylglucosaminyl-diphospho-decaprenol L-rhamnosyltransferase
MDPDKKIAIIAVNFNSEFLLPGFIKDIQKQYYKNWYMLIVNCSENNSQLEEILNANEDIRIKVLNVNRNIGFARANNLGFEFIRNNKIINSDDIVLFSNLDISIMQNNIFSSAIGMFERLNCGFLGPKIINTDGTIMSPHQKPANFLNIMFHLGNNGIVDRINGYGKKYKNAVEPLKVFLLNGSFLLCKAQEFISAGMFDEGTFLYYEEELLFSKVAGLNIPVIYYPEITVHHQHSVVVNKTFNKIEKRKITTESEVYLLRKEMNINRFCLFLFMIERKLELFLIKIFLK